MAASKRLVLDANILIRAVLGVRVRSLIEARCERIAFFVASESLEEAVKYLGEIAAERGIEVALLLECPIRTEDRDFFGSGVATWTTATVERYRREPAK